ncbi:MAG: metallophosphoesterase [Desulfobacter sp.]|nr:MAG: metallophosphoesterase [Desulfobacter sp.]
MYFFIAAILALTLIYGLFGIRVIRPARVNPRLKALLWALLSICYLALPIAVFFRFNTPDSPVSIPLSWFAYVSFGFFTLTFAAILLRDSLFFIFKSITTSIKQLSALKFSSALPPSFTRVKNLAPKDSSKRLFLVNTTNLALLGATGSLTGYGVGHARQIPRVVDIQVVLDSLPPEFEGFKILQLTDIHVSMTIRRDYVKAVVDKANDQNADMIVLTGDLADGHVKDLRSETAPLAALKAGFGKFFVTGNHEYYSGVESWLAEINALGFTSLLNENRMIHRNGAQISLSGVTDYRAGQIVPLHASSPKAALASVPENLTKIMLAHQPKSIFQAEAAGADLLITGHTHGGQYIPWNYLVPLDQPYVKGLHTHGHTQIYVSRGTGYWGPPLRIGAPSEITVFTLVQKKA